MLEKEYVKYSIEDFAWDEDFRKWVNEPTISSDDFWNGWLLKNPGKTGVVNAAKQIIRSIRVKDIEINTEEIDREVGNILNNIDKPILTLVTGPADETTVDPVGTKSNRFYILPAKIAAAFILLIGIGIVFNYYFNSQKKGLQQIASDYGTIKKVLLPDSSVIVLNGNSRISFSKQWKDDQPREIWLDGEGYFAVKHLNKTKEVNPGERFIVHVKNINVEVLGTTFDIRHRRNKTIIVLNTGSIRVSNESRSNPIIMKPGEMATFSSEKNDQVIISQTEPKEFSAWTEKKLMVNNASAKEIFQYLEDNYGKKVQLDDQSLLNRRIEGTIMLDNLEDALFVLSKVLNVKIYNTDSSILIKEK